MSIDAILVAASVLGGFAIHLFYFGRGMGEMKADIRHLANSFDDFKSQHFIPREEYEARHTEMMKIFGTRVNP